MLFQNVYKVAQLGKCKRFEKLAPFCAHTISNFGTTPEAWGIAKLACLTTLKRESYFSATQEN